MNLVFIIGMAGSGKSFLTASFADWLKLNQQNVLTVNLDPGALSLPYGPDVDVRGFVDIGDLMDRYQLGPNGALIMAADLIAEHMEEIEDSIEEAKPELVLIDTPGQIELFAFRESGSYITKFLTEEPKTVIYIHDGPFSRNPLNYVSNLFIGAAVYSRLLKPQVFVLSKTDLLNENELQEILAWSEDEDRLDEAIQEKLGKTESIISRDVAHALAGTGLVFEPIPVSAKRSEGFIELNAALTRIQTGGEELRP